MVHPPAFSIAWGVFLDFFGKGCGGCEGIFFFAWNDLFL